MAGRLRGRARARRDGRAGDARAHGQSRQPLRARRSAAVSRTARRRFVQLLRPRRGLYAALSAMHDCRLLERLITGFGRISGRMIRDFYHKYTVDEHTLLTVRGIERLVTKPSKRPRFADLLAELHSPERLVLALLLHDVGKWKDENHAEESARMAQVIFDELGLDGEARHDVEFLIVQHLEMSRVTFRRDNSDARVIRQFADLVGTEARLQMLCLLTLADIGAVGPGTLTPWKEDLLWEVFVRHLQRADAWLRRQHDCRRRGGAGRPRKRPAVRPRRRRAVARPRGLSAPLPDAASTRRRSTAMSASPATSARRGPPAARSPRRRLGAGGGGPGQAAPVLEHLRHARLLRDGHPARQRDDQPERPGPRHLPFRRRRAASSTATRMARRASRRCCRTSSPAARTSRRGCCGRRRGCCIAGRRCGSRRSIRVDNEQSPTYTVLELVAQDAPGLLHRVSRVVSGHGCEVDLVLISTEGNRAIDVFHLTQSAAKLPRPVSHALKVDLERLLQEGS